MPKIHVMTDALASQVAAGEVVQRPASVVKELVENSIDAGARQIIIEIEKGGAGLIRVTDDGYGMAREDILLAMERHSTSKLKQASDLTRLTTYGFRGEALPSIASVSRFRISSCEKEALAGTEIIVDGGVFIDVSDCGAAPGTRVEARDLFYNVPARRKFLKTQATEFSHIEEVVRLVAMVQPGIAFTLRHNSREVIRLASASRQIDRITDLVGIHVIEHLIAFNGSGNDSNLTVSGWISEPGFSRRNRKMQHYFLNSRPIDSPAVSLAIKDAYTGFIDRGAFPSAFIFIHADPASIDVNVHPAKHEVRFHNNRYVQEVLSDSIKVAIIGKFTQEMPSAQSSLVSQSDDLRIGVSFPEALDLGSSTVNDSKANTPDLDLTTPSVKELQLDVNLSCGQGSSHRIIGIHDKRYLVVEGADGLVLVHRRAAHERILYEEWMEGLKGKGNPSQALLSPVTVELSAAECEIVLNNSKLLSKMGLGTELFGEKTIKLDSLPAICGDIDPVDFFISVVGELAEGGIKSAMRFSDSDIVGIVCSRAARYNESSSVQELSALVDRLMECEMPYCDVRGRPTMIQFSRRELERRFNAVPAK
jgi:DNA mismatch repair protein MutL